MATTASKSSFANGKLGTSTRKGNTRVSLSRAMARWKFSVAEVPLSVAHTWTSNSRARKIELVALPHPSSRTRMPGLNGRWRARLSAWHSAFSPRAFLRIKRSSYFAVRGKASLSIKEFTLDCVGSSWTREHDAIYIKRCGRVQSESGTFFALDAVKHFPDTRLRLLQTLRLISS